MRTYLCLAALLMMAGCTKNVTRDQLRQMCDSRRLTCELDDTGEGRSSYHHRWMASARRDNGFGHYDEWFGNGDTQEEAMGDLASKLDGAPSWPGLRENIKITQP